MAVTVALGAGLTGCADSAALGLVRQACHNVNESLALYRKAAMSLDQLMAFTVSDDHAAQEAAWFDAPEWQRNASAIRQRLTAAGG